MDPRVAVTARCDHGSTTRSTTNLADVTVARASDLAPYRTGDGSLTLRSAQYGEGYHSVHGAVVESTHVFISSGLQFVIDRCGDRLNAAPIRVLEIGLGTGLNLLLTWIRCLEGKCNVDYTALEPFPLPESALEQLAYWEELSWPGLKKEFLEMMRMDEQRHEKNGLTFRWNRTPVEELAERAEYDLVYFDAFAPSTDPAMWKADVLERVYGSMREGAVFVTYCAKGEVRRTLASIGFSVERLQGPPGKREMLRATK